MLITHSTFQVFHIQYILSKARPKALALFVKVKKVRLILLDYILLFSPHLGEGYKLRILRGELASAVLLYIYYTVPSGLTALLSSLGLGNPTIDKNTIHDTNTF